MPFGVVESRHAQPFQQTLSSDDKVVFSISTCVNGDIAVAILAQQGDCSSITENLTEEAVTPQAGGKGKERTYPE